MEMPSTQSPPREHHPLVIGVAAGLLAGTVTAMTDKLLGRLVSEEQKRRDKMVRPGSAHEVAGPHFGTKIVGHELSEQGAQRAKTLFNLAYGIGWGLVYAGVRRQVPQLSRLAALPFGVIFFAACDGMLAPLFGVSPTLRKIPWQPNAKELGNHLAWAASAEMVHRTATRLGG